VVVGEAVGVASDPLREHVDVLDPCDRRLASAVVGKSFGLPVVDHPSEPGRFGSIDVSALGQHDQEVSPHEIGRPRP
jgi:hypothetical protein